MKKVYASKKAKKVEKGISFPTCISINNICGPFSPLKDESIKLSNGDIAKMYSTELTI
jgi:methionine aminopeptidase